MDVVGDGVDVDRDEYWAAKPTDEVGAQIVKRVDEYHEYLNSSGRTEIIKKSYGQYYNAIRTYADVRTSGKDGEFTLVSVNDYRNILLHIISLTASDRLAFDPVAINTDSESVAQCTLAQGLLDYYMRERRLEEYVKGSLETCLWGGDAFAALSWDVDAGDEYGIGEDNKPLKAGDLKVKTYHVGTCIRDYNLLDANHERWKILIDFESRFELMAKYPSLAEEIKSVSLDAKIWQYLFYFNRPTYNCDELIPVYELRHEKTDAMPNGRIVRIVSSDIVLLDSPLPYKKTHVYRISPTNQANSIFGYTVGYDLLPLQTSVDSLHSIALSNNSTFGVQCIAVPQGSEIIPSDVMGGMKILYYNSQLGKPEPLQLTATAPETYSYMNILGQAMERLAAINPVTRGSSDSLSQSKSGAALALLQSMAIQFNSQLQQSYVNFAEDIGTGIIEILQTFASQPRVAQIAGKNKRSLIKYWTSKDLASIRRVQVNIGNPLMRTVAGRENFAEQLLQTGLIHSPDQLLEVYNTGRIEPLTEYPLAELQLIRDENEVFMTGENCPVVMTDNHDLHIKEHGSVLASTESRKDARVLQAVLSHIQDHINTKMTQSPILAALTGQTPVPQQPQGLPPGAPPGAGGPPLANNGPDIGLGGGAPPEVPGGPNLPGLPTNPLTHQKYDPVTGGGIVGLPT